MEEDAKHGLLKCSGPKKWRDELVCSKRIVIVACEKVLDCTYVTEIKSAGRYLYKIRCKWKNVIRAVLFLGLPVNRIKDSDKYWTDVERL